MAKTRKDVFSKEQRGVVMSKIKSKNSLIEKTVFSYLKSKGVYFKKHHRKIFGCPDIALPSRKRVIFIDSDFWHGWQYPRWKKTLPSDFWRTKIETNRKRDKTVNSKLRRGGYKVLRIWSHQILGKSKDDALERARLFLTED